MTYPLEKYSLTFTIFSHIVVQHKCLSQNEKEREISRFLGDIQTVTNGLRIFAINHTKLN